LIFLCKLISIKKYIAQGDDIMEATRSRRDRQRKRSGNGGMLLVMAILILGFGITLLTMQGEYLHPVSSAGQALDHTPTFVYTLTHIDNINDTGYLALINRKHMILNELNADALVSIWPAVPVSFVEGMYLQSTALQAVGDMINTARSADIGSFFVSSGFRGQDVQAMLYDNGANSGFALPPGHSEHHTGLAIDILAAGVSQAEMGSSREGRWLADYSYRYGLILRYPQGATHITGIEFEPWHFRYVGRPHAYYMKQNNLVLEEYIKLIQSTGVFSFEMDRRNYYVLYQTPRDGMIYLPSDLAFTVSNDNMGGFIVTAWE